MKREKKKKFTDKKIKKSENETKRNHWQYAYNYTA